MNTTNISQRAKPVLTAALWYCPQHTPSSGKSINYQSQWDVSSHESVQPRRSQTAPLPALENLKAARHLITRPNSEQTSLGQWRAFCKTKLCTSLRRSSCRRLQPTAPRVFSIQLSNNSFFEINLVVSYHVQLRVVYGRAGICVGCCFCLHWLCSGFLRLLRQVGLVE